MKLNLGCGEKRKDGYLNVDLYGSPDIRCDLSQFPWPFDSESADEVFSEHFLEHVLDYDQTILEMHRILKPKGTLHFKVPHFRNPMTPWHLHRWQFSTYTCERLCQRVPYLWEGRQLFEKQKIRINFAYTRRSVARPLEALANISTYFWDWMGFPIDEVEFIGIKRH